MVHGKGLNDLKGLPYDRRIYDCWKNMLSRVYGRTASGFYLTCSISEDWLKFSSFNRWASSQKWEGLVLDKDIVKIGNDVYCEEFCRFVDKELNFSFIRSNPFRKSRSNGLPFGVYLSNNGKRFYAKGVDRFGDQCNLGTVDDAKAAHLLWQLNKLKRLKYLANLTSDSSILERLAFEIDRLSHDVDSEVESNWY